MWRPQKAANVTNPHTEDLQEKRERETERDRERERETCWKEDTDVGKGIAAHYKIKER
jgi:hypothetical protein